MADVSPKPNTRTPWPYLVHGDWRCLIGTLGWATIYHLDAPGCIGRMESRRVDDLDGVVSLAKSVIRT